MESLCACCGFVLNAGYRVRCQQALSSFLCRPVGLTKAMSHTCTVGTVHMFSRCLILQVVEHLYNSYVYLVVLGLTPCRGIDTNRPRCSVETSWTMKRGNPTSPYRSQSLPAFCLHHSVYSRYVVRSRRSERWTERWIPLSIGVDMHGETVFPGCFEWLQLTWQCIVRMYICKFILLAHCLVDFVVLCGFPAAAAAAAGMLLYLRVNFCYGWVSLPLRRIRSRGGHG